VNRELRVQSTSKAKAQLAATAKLTFSYHPFNRSFPIYQNLVALPTSSSIFRLSTLRPALRTELYCSTGFTAARSPDGDPTTTIVTAKRHETDQHSVDDLELRSGAPVSGSTPAQTRSSSNAPPGDHRLPSSTRRLRAYATRSGIASNNVQLRIPVNDRTYTSLSNGRASATERKLHGRREQSCGVRSLIHHLPILGTYPR
jgi:hypothetical protein